MKISFLYPALAFAWLASIVGAYFVGREALRAEIASEFKKSFAKVAEDMKSDPPKESPEVPDAETETTPSPPDAASFKRVRVSLPEFVKKFESNQVAAQDWAKDKLIQFTATIDTIQPADSPEGAVNLRFEATVREFFNPTVRVTFPKAFRSQISKFHAGQKVTCLAVFRESGFADEVEMDGYDVN